MTDKLKCGAKSEIKYVNCSNVYALNEFSEAFYRYLAGMTGQGGDICILCIGTDRSTGDSLGPIIGQRLSESTALIPHTHVYGTLQSPVHAKNLAPVVAELYGRHSRPMVIAVDASLGHTEHVGYLTTGYGTISPGAGLKKNLQPVGDIFVTGIVNFSGIMDFNVLQSTRLGLVMRMADVAYAGILNALLKLRHKI